MTYRITKSPVTHANVWWEADETIADGYEYVRDATPEEAELITRILKQDASGRIPALTLGDRLNALLNPPRAVAAEGER
ncbi:MAG TPA: hypothetical protein VIO57_10075 [Chloroflexota bacterium]|jgi:hypothetical protein